MGTSITPGQFYPSLAAPVRAKHVPLRSDCISRAGVIDDRALHVKLSQPMRGTRRPEIDAPPTDQAHQTEVDS